MNNDLRENILKRWGALKTEREPYLSQWREISEHITPASGKFLSGDRNNRAKDRWNHIYNSTATRAANILAAGLMSGLTDPSSQWFALTTGDPDLDATHAVKQWVDQVQRILEMAYTRTNTYQAFHHGWREAGCYGILANVVLEDAQWGFHCKPLVAGEYCIACNHRGEPDTLYRRFSMTAAQLVTKYGRDKVSHQVLMNYDNGNYDRVFKCIHAIEPRYDRDPTKKDNRNMPWRSCVIQIDADEGSDGILEDSGYNEFPAIVGRWGASASDVYSEEAPGMIAIGDTLQLQHEELQKGNVIDYQVNPPIILPTSAKDSAIDFLPGGRSFVDLPSSANQAKSAWDVPLMTGDLREDIQQVQQRINQAFSVDMFLMLSGGVKNMTATEVAERHEEKLMMLGPVVSRFNNEVLRNFIDRTYNILARAGQIPPPPPELEGKDLSIEYTSMLARSQRAIRATSLDNFMSRIGQLAQFKPEVIAKINPYNAVDEYADYYNVAPSVLVPTEEAMAQIQQQQEAQAQAQQEQQMMQSVDAMAKLGKIPTDQENMATGLAQGLAGAAGEEVPAE